MTRLAPSLKRRTGAIAPLTALLLIPVLAMVAFGIDLGYIVMVKSDLQNAADAAALAGTQQLAHYFPEWVPPSAQRAALRATAIDAAKTAARNFATSNKAGGVSISLIDADIECGYIDAQGNYSSTPAGDQFPNTVRITARRDDQANGSLGLFFAPILGKPSQALVASARATMYTAEVNSFKNVRNLPAHVLPYTYDVDHWNNFLQTAKSPDGTTSVARDGTPQLQIYPSVKFPGNFGELSLDDTHTGASNVRSWIDLGMQPADWQNLMNNNLIPLCFHDQTKWDWVGNTGFRSTNAQSINNYVGQTFLLPLFKAKDPRPDSNYQAGVGTGSNYAYNIVAFVPIKIMPPNDVNRDVQIQPASYVDPTAVMLGSTMTPAGTGSTTTAYETTVTTPKLSQ